MHIYTSIEKHRKLIIKEPMELVEHLAYRKIFITSLSVLTVNTYYMGGIKALVIVSGTVLVLD